MCVDLSYFTKQGTLADSPSNLSENGGKLYSNVQLLPMHLLTKNVLFVFVPLKILFTTLYYKLFGSTCK